MSRIEINADGRHIIVDHGGELEPLRAAALKLWQDTAVPDPSPGPATGFQLTERRYTAPVAPVGNGTRLPPAPVIAVRPDPHL